MPARRPRSASSSSADIRCCGGRSGASARNRRTWRRSARPTLLRARSTWCTRSSPTSSRSTARCRTTRAGIVIVTANESDDLLFRALDTGASAFITQAATILEIVSAIRHAAVSAGSFSASGLAQALRRRRETSERLTLSPRERQVLALLREGKSVPEVAATIYVSLSTAKTYVARLYEKLGASNRAQALMTAVDLGLFDESGAVAV
jgi:DNA-binding NarL/FixJ family response regulator